MDPSIQQGPVKKKSYAFPPFKSFLRSYAVVLGVTILAAIVITVIILRREYTAILEHTRVTLSHVANSNERLFVAWVNERMTDARTIASFPGTIATLSSNGRPNRTLQQSMTEVLNLYKEGNDYADVTVLNPGGEVVASSTGTPPPDAAIMDAARASGTSDGVLTIPRPGPETTFARTAAFSPVMQNGRRLGTVVLVVRATQLRSIFVSDDMASSTGETLLAIRAGGKAMFISPLRGLPKGAPIPTPGIAELLAVQGERRFGEFTDYTGRRVFAVTRRVPVVGWGMVTKVNQSEALAGFWMITLSAATILLTFLALLVSIAYAIWRHDQVDFLREDVERRRQNEEKLRQSEERFVKAFRANPIGMTITNLTDGKYVEINDAFARMIGYEREEMVGKNVMDTGILPDEATQNALIEKLRRGESIREESLELRTKSGRMITVELSAEVIQIQEWRRLLSLVRDVTEQRKLEMRLRQAQKMEAVGQLAGGIAHDFNNLLAIILGSAEVMLEKCPSHDLNRARLQMIYEASERAAGLTKQLLAFSRKSVMQLKIVEINSVLADTEKMLGRLIGENIEFTIRMNANPGQVIADPGQIVQLLMNLSVNARDAMPEGGTLTIETGNANGPDPALPTILPVKTGPYVTVSVRDTGTGMDAATQAQIFEPFFSTKEIGKGTGLGLSTVYGVVEQGNGFIQVKSAVGQGTMFVIYLPMAVTPADTQEAEAQRSGNRNGKETVLLVEDETMLRKLTADALRDSGYAVLEAKDAMDAVRIAKTHVGQIDLLLTDVVMPKMSGHSVAAEVQAIRQGIKVLYMSGYNDNELVQRAINGHGSGFLQKPFARPELLHEIRRTLDCSKKRCGKSGK